MYCVCVKHFSLDRQTDRETDRQIDRYKVGFLVYLLYPIMTFEITIQFLYLHNISGNNRLCHDLQKWLN